MAVFFKNDCKFHGCGKTFPSLCSLIEHIEAVHIDFDPKVTAEFEEQGITGIPLSYVLKYSHCRHVHETTSADIKVRLIQHATKSALEKQINGFVARHHIQDEETFSESESSNDSWTPTKEVILPERKNGTSAVLWKDKPFVCSVPGCKKRYKNINGIKYHYKNGHKIFDKPKKNIKPASRKGNKGRNVKISTKKICLENALAVQIPSTSKATDSALVLGNENCEVVVPEHEDNKEKYIPVSLNSNNNNECHPADCTSTFVNTCIQWPTAASARGDLTIIRSSMENNISNNFITYFSECSNSQHAS